MTAMAASMSVWEQQCDELQTAVAMPSCGAREPAILKAFAQLAASVRNGSGDARVLAQLLERHVPGERSQWREILTDDDFIAELARGEKVMTATTLQGCIDMRDWARLQGFAQRWLEASSSPLSETDALSLMRLVVTHVAVYDHGIAKQLFTELATRYPLIAQLQQDDREVKNAFAVGSSVKELSLAARCYLCELMHSYSGQSHVGIRHSTTVEQQEIVQHLKTLPAKSVVRTLLYKRFPHEFGVVAKSHNKVIAIILFLLSTAVVTTVWVALDLPPVMGMVIVGSIGFGLWRKARKARK